MIPMILRILEEKVSQTQCVVRKPCQYALQSLSARFFSIVPNCFYLLQQRFFFAEYWHFDSHCLMCIEQPRLAAGRFVVSQQRRKQRRLIGAGILCWLVGLPRHIAA